MKKQTDLKISKSFRIIEKSRQKTTFVCLGKCF